MAARRRGIGSRVGAPIRPILMSRIWAMARIVPKAVNDSVRQTIFPVRPQGTILTAGGKQPCVGSNFGFRAMALTRISRLAPDQVQSRWTGTSGLEPGKRAPGQALAHSWPGHLAR